MKVPCFKATLKVQQLQKQRKQEAAIKAERLACWQEGVCPDCASERVECSVLGMYQDIEYKCLACRAHDVFDGEEEDE